MFSLAPFLLRDIVDPTPRYEDLLSELYGNPYRDAYSSPHLHLNIIRPRRQNSVGAGQQSDSKADNKFKVMLNVKQFRPDEIDVKTVDNFVVVHGKHEEHADEHGFVSREFTRRYQLPDDVEPEKVTSSLSKDGVLTIQAPKKMIEPPPKNERVVPITIQQPAAVEEAQKLAEQQQQQQQQQMQEASEDKK